MMIEVVSWNPSKGRKSIKDSYPVTKQLTHLLALEGRRVQMVVGNHPALIAK